MGVTTDFQIEAIYLQGAAEEFSCERAGECDREAVYRVAWMPDDEGRGGERVDPCACGPHSYLMCLPCHDLLSSRDGLVWCVRCSPVGPMRFKAIVAARPVRRSL